MNYPNIAFVSDAATESLVIGFLLQIDQVEHADAWMSQLDQACFYNQHQREAFEAMAELMAMDPPQPPSLMNVSIQLRAAHPDSKVMDFELADWFAHADSTDVTVAVDVLRNLKVRRALQKLGYDLIEKAARPTEEVGDLVDMAQNVLDMQDVTHRHRGTPLRSLTGPLKERVTRNQDDDTRSHGPWTGIEVLDAQGGLPESGLVVLAGGTSQGKSSMASNFVLHSARHGLRSAYFSMEMSNQSLVARMVAMEQRGISAQGIRSWKLNADDLRRTLSDIDQLDAKFGEMVYFDDTRSSNLQDICSGIRYMHQAYGIRLVVVDFLQLLNFNTTRRDLTTEQLMGQASRTLKNLADRLGLCVVLLSQINRSQSNMRPSLAVIRDSGQIAEAADMVIFCWRPWAYHGSYDLDFADYTTAGTMAFLLLKNREGALMERLLRWVSEHTLPIDIPDHELTTFRKSYGGEGERGLFD